MLPAKEPVSPIVPHGEGVAESHRDTPGGYGQAANTDTHRWSGDDGAPGGREFPVISIAGWEIRRRTAKRTTEKTEKKPEKGTPEKRGAAKRTAGRKPGEGSGTTSGRGTTGGGEGAGGQKGTGGREASGAAKRGTRRDGALTKRSRAAEPRTAKQRTMKPRAADPRSTQPGAGKTGAGRTDRTAGTDRTARTARAARTTSPPEPQDAPVKGPLQRDSFGSHLARAMVLLLAFVCMVGFAVALAKATLVPSPASVDLVHTNLRPGQSLRTYLDQPAFRDTVKQIGGNVLLGAPFGVLLPVLVPKARGALRVVVVTALVMVAVEAAQGLIVEGRAFDIDDVILNTTGALLGYVVIGRRLGRALHPRRRHCWHRWTQRPPAA